MPITAKVACNEIHGNLTLVARNTTATEYALICICKEPGLIGNKDLLGNCTTPFLCEGKIDDINKPIKQINCHCEKNQLQVRFDNGVPHCKEISIKEANATKLNWGDLLEWGDKPTQPLEIFNADITSNLKVDKLLDPCKVSLLDSSKRIPFGRYNKKFQTCVTHNSGIPATTGILKASTYKTNALKRTIPYKTVDALIHSNDYEGLRFLDALTVLQRQITARVQPPWRQEPISIVLPAPLGLRDTRGDDSTGGQISMDTLSSCYSGKCRPDGVLTYKCYFDDYFEKYENGIPRPGYLEPPPWFWWNTEIWYSSEALGKDGVPMTETGLVMNQNVYLSRDEFKIFGFEIANATNSGFILFKSELDAKIHKNASLPPV